MPVVDAPGEAGNRCRLTLVGHKRGVKTLAYYPGRPRVYSGSSDGTIRVWDVSTGEGTQVLEGHTAPVGVLTLSPGGDRLFSGSEDGTVREWECRYGEPIVAGKARSRVLRSAGHSMRRRRRGDLGSRPPGAAALTPRPASRC